MAAYTIRCHNCGHEFEAEKWQPGTECPRCNSADTLPLRKKYDAAEEAQGASAAPEKKKAAGVDWKRSPLVGVIAVAVIVLGWAGLAYWKFAPQKIERIEVVAMCANCGERFERFTDELPCNCPVCGAENSVYWAYECMGKKGKPCGHVFAYIPPPPPKSSYKDDPASVLVPDPERDKAVLRARTCPRCGSTRTRLLYTEKQKAVLEEMEKK